MPSWPPGLPLYQRIVRTCATAWQRGELLPGAQVETELELMARYGVSRATVRQALGGLIADGLAGGPPRPGHIRPGASTWSTPWAASTPSAGRSSVTA